jgi:hypothetical protein
MRITLGLSLLALAAAAPAWAQAQYAPPPGPYQRQCSNITMNGQMMSATCRGDRAVGNSSINILSCSTAISVDADGGLTCVGPGAGAPPAVRPAPPGYATAPGQAPNYAPNGPGYDGRPGYGRPDRPGYGRDSVTLFGARDFRGRPVVIDRPTANLQGMGLNDQVRSIQLDRRSGPWIVCSDADYRGRCVTVDRSIADVGRIGMRGQISSLRPIR